MMDLGSIQMMEATASQSSASPSFNSYSSETLAEIAARVLEELRTDPLSVSDDDALFHSWESNHYDQRCDDCINDQHPNDAVQGDGDFEFALVCRDPNSSPVSADDIFYNGQIKPMYPIFDRSLVFTHPHFAPPNDVVPHASISPPPTPSETMPVRRHRLPLRKLMFEERETGSCSSSASDVDGNDLGGPAPETYCVWSPKSASAGRRERKKSTSTGPSSKRWNLRDLLLLRSGSQSSGRKEGVVFLSQSKRSRKVAQEVSKPGAEQEFPYYMREGPAKEGDLTKKKSFLPHRHELIGIFSNVNGLGRSLHPF